MMSKGGRQRVNINVAINIDSLQMTVDFSQSITSPSTLRLLTELERPYSLAENIHVILDNAKYYHSKEVLEWLARHKKFKLHFLPPYSPNLNLIERLWKFFNEKVRNNRYYVTFSDLPNRVDISFVAESSGRKNYAHDSPKTFTASKPMF